MTLGKLHRDASRPTWVHRLVVTATLAGWIILVGLIASLYIGHGSSPYDMCTGANRRGVACALLNR